MANYSTTFSGETTGANSTTMTNRWATETSISVENPGVGETDSRALKFGSADSGFLMQSLDAIDGDANRANCDILARFRVGTNDDGQWLITGRASGSGGSETGYYVAVDSIRQIEIHRVVSGSITTLAARSLQFPGLSQWRAYDYPSLQYTPANVWLNARLRINGTGATVTITLTWWWDGQDEETGNGYPLVYNDTSGSRITAAGWCGFGKSIHNADTYLDAFAAASNGDVATLPAGTSASRITQISAHALRESTTDPVRLTTVNAGALYTPTDPTVRVTTVNASALYTRIPPRIGAAQTVIATIGTGFD